MARNAISRELYADLVAKGMIKEQPRRALARELRGRKCKNKALARACANALEGAARMALPVAFSFDWPPSLNAMWATTTDTVTGAQIRVLTKEARAWRARFALAFKLAHGAHGGLAYDGPLELQLVFCGRFFHANGSMRQVDLSNRIKLLEDALASALHYDDSRHWRLTLQKQVSDVEQVKITLMPHAPLGPESHNAAPAVP